MPYFTINIKNPSRTSANVIHNTAFSSLSNQELYVRPSLDGIVSTQSFYTDKSIQPTSRYSLFPQMIWGIIY